ncbi:MAG: 30S ribosomal protein S6 [Spirochaetes bacterium GWC1_27_15]|nr:MAG: 30S ribosomal protein S6 [Spirochaetes bacterium GWB1_27_13]OHD21656.1 MAG: 30S ribosomal protein S6 [Spirochaetes bacterium GWC1_27_15]
MKKYEMMVIYNTEERPLEETKTFVKDTFSSNNIKVIDEKDMGMRELAYLINKKKRGYYYLFNFEAEPASIKEMNAAFKLYKGIFKNLVLVQE